MHGRIFIEAGTPDAQAARIVAAVESWVADIDDEAGHDRLDGAQVDRELGDAWAARNAVRTVDLFGPDARGGYLVATAHPSGGWTILIELTAVNGDTTPYRWVEKIFFRRTPEA